MQEQPTETGTVKWFNERRGFGFIMRAGKEDIFVHYTEIKSKQRRCSYQADMKFDNTPGVPTDPMHYVYAELGDDFAKLAEMTDEELEKFMDPENRYPGSYHG